MSNLSPDVRGVTGKALGARGSLTLSRKIGYASGIVSESVLYNMFYVYFVIFLTDVVRMNPALAGTVGLLAILCDAVTDPLIGYLSDKEGVDKRKVILYAALPMAITFIAAFAVFDFSQIGKFIYYSVISMLFWVAYTCICIPYYALGAEITGDYDERTKIRGISSFINSFAIFAGCVFPVVFVGVFTDMGVSEPSSWTLSAAVMGIIGAVFAVVIYLSLRKVILVKPKRDERAGSVNIFKTYLEIIKIKPIRRLIPFIFFYMVGSSMSQSNIQFLIQYRVGADPDLIALVILITVITMLIFVPITTWLATKTDRKAACMAMFGLAAAGILVMRFVGIDSTTAIFVLTFFAGIGTAAFWTLFYSFAYDTCEVDEYVNGARREGAITAFPQFIQKFGSAIGIWIVGLILAAVGYNPDLPQQSEVAMRGIENISTTYLAAAIILSLVFIAIYPVSKKRYNALKEALEKKKAGEEYHSDEVESIL